MRKEGVLPGISTSGRWSSALGGLTATHDAVALLERGTFRTVPVAEVRWR